MVQRSTEVNLCVCGTLVLTALGGKGLVEAGAPAGWKQELSRVEGGVPEVTFPPKVLVRAAQYSLYSLCQI